MNNRSRLLLAASLAGALAAPMITATASHAGDEKAAEKAPCYGVNKCKGVGECSGPGHGCAGQNACKHQGWISMEKELCLKIDGGRLTANEEKKMK